MVHNGSKDEIKEELNQMFISYAIMSVAVLILVLLCEYALPKFDKNWILNFFLHQDFIHNKRPLAN